MMIAVCVLALPFQASSSNEVLTSRLNEAGLALGSKTFIRIFKREAELEVWMKDGEEFRILHTYPICYFSGSLGPKLKEGDLQSPEGFYAVTAKQLNPNSRFHKAFNLGYPNEYDRAHGRTGSALMVHGNCVSIGCYAMTDPGITEIYQLVEKALRGGQKRMSVHVFPFRMTEENMSTAPAGRWTDFWRQMKAGYDHFEKTRVPPRIGVCDKNYVVGNDAKKCRMIAGW